jgi:hypothetical protein
VIISLLLDASFPHKSDFGRTKNSITEGNCQHKKYENKKEKKDGSKMFRVTVQPMVQMKLLERINLNYLRTRGVMKTSEIELRANEEINVIEKGNQSKYHPKFSSLLLK